jgi:aminomethyltransferase
MQAQSTGLCHRPARAYRSGHDCRAGPRGARQGGGAASPALADLINGLDVFVGACAGEWFISRTGYTGEDGLEILLPNAEAPAFWRELLAAGVLPCGLGRT